MQWQTQATHSMMIRPFVLMNLLIWYLLLIVSVALVTGLSKGYTPPTYRSVNRAQHTSSLIFASTNQNDDGVEIIRTDNDDAVQPLSYTSKHATRRMTLQQMIAAVGGITTSSSLSGISPAIASSAATSSAVVPTPPQLRSTTWPLGKVAFSLLPLAGTYSRRATIMEELVNDGSNGIWTFDQIQGVVNVNVPVRMVVVKVCM